MLCKSGFELYSRWVPLINSNHIHSLSVAITFIAFDHVVCDVELRFCHKSAIYYIGCAQKTFFKDEKPASKMKYLKSVSEEELSLKGDVDCVVTSTSSWYIDCQGKRMNLPPTRRFTIIKSDTEEPLNLEVQIRLY